jgi:hypothetical protein
MAIVFRQVVCASFRATAIMPAAVVAFYVWTAASAGSPFQ